MKVKVEVESGAHGNVEVELERHDAMGDSLSDLSEMIDKAVVKTKAAYYA